VARAARARSSSSPPILACSLTLPPPFPLFLAPPPPPYTQTNWYDVSYKSMLPKRGTGVNVLVPVGLSASAVAYSSTRIENMFMSLGTAAGVAAAQVVAGEASTVQDVDVGKVQAVLVGVFEQRIHGPPGSKQL
jgi:hypothetical protein